MGVVAYIEFTGVSRVRRLDPAAAKTLGYNQLAFGALLMIYGIWMMQSSATTAEFDSVKQQLSQVYAASQIDSWMRMVRHLSYALIVAIPTLAMGSTALFYFSREKHIRQYIQTTAPWIVEMQRSGGPL